MTGPLSIHAALARVCARADLARGEMADVIGAIMDGGATPAQIGGLLVGLRAKGETVDEIVGAATAMRARATPIAIDDALRARSIDTCGTGGDGAGTINISTLAAIVVAACGGVVAKHGNRALSSKCGSADVLETLGVAVDSEPEVAARALAGAGIAFLFAPRFHAATRHVGGVRKELATRTIFNLLGPLTNPAHVAHQVVGVYAAAWCAPIAAALGALGLRRAAVVHGHGGLDELAVDGPTTVARWDRDDGRVHVDELTPADFGVAPLDPRALAGGDAAHNARVLRETLAGETGIAHVAARTAAALTAALALELLEPTPFDRARLPHQLARATDAVVSGRAAATLARWTALQGRAA